MSRCNPLNPLQLKRNKEQVEDVNSSESERELDYLLNLFLDETSEDDNTNSDFVESDDDQPGDELSASCMKIKNRLSSSSSSEKIVISGNKKIKEENTTDKEATQSHSESPYTHVPVIVKTEPVSPEPDASPKPEPKVIREPICMPTRKNWVGSHSFTIRVPYTENLKLTNTAVYSPAENKLYVTKNSEFQVLFNVNSVPPGSVIRATAFYTKVADAFEVVKRCPEHVHEDKVAGKVLFEHVLQSFHSQASYERNEQSGRCSVVVPYQDSEKGSEDLFCIPYKFICWSSCIGGINRRPFMIHFTLVNKDELLGRQVLHVRVCASPLRDFRSETKKHVTSTSTLDSNINSTNSNPQNYSILTKDRKLYLFLKQMKHLYETSASAENLMQIVLPALTSLS